MRVQKEPWMGSPEVVKNRTSMISKMGLNGKACAEVGVYEGGFASCILNFNPSRLYLIDSWSGYGEAYRRWPGCGESGYQTTRFKFRDNPVVEILRKTSLEAALEFQNSSLDFAYIDARHYTAFVYADLLLWYPRIKKGGWLAGHDLDHPDYAICDVLKMFTEVTGEKLAFVTDEQADMNSWAFRKTR